MSDQNNAENSHETSFRDRFTKSSKFIEPKNGDESPSSISEKGNLESDGRPRETSSLKTSLATQDENESPDSKSKALSKVEKLERRTVPHGVKFSQMRKLSEASLKILMSLKDKANKKSFGRKVRDSEIIEVALKKVTPEDLESLQEQTFSEQDRLKMAHEQYVKKNGKITFDAFIGKLLKGELQNG